MGVRRCPLLTMRAPECATGGLFKFCKVMFDTCNGVLRGHPCMRDLPETDVMKLMSDFVRARRYIVFSLEVKLSFWTNLPYTMAGMAYWDPGVAREAGRRCLALYESAGSAVRSHWWCQVLLAPGSVGRALLEEWLDGRDDTVDDDDNIFSRMLSRFAFIPVSERWIEARHSLSNRALTGARHGGVVFLAWSML